MALSVRSNYLIVSFKDWIIESRSIHPYILCCSHHPPPVSNTGQVAEVLTTLCLISYNAWSEPFAMQNSTM